MKTDSRCSICGHRYVGMGHNAQPVSDGRCCGDCNAIHVIPARIAAMFGKPEPKESDK